MEAEENSLLQWLWHSYEGYLLSISQNKSEENHFFLDDFYLALLKECSVDSMNCGKVRCDPFILILLNIEEDRRRIGVV